MRTLKSLTLPAAIFIILLCHTNADGATPSGVNIALGRPYLLEPMPDYPYCTDPGDTTQLTDGQSSPAYKGSRFVNGPLWTQISTVGWQNTRFVKITIDLGSVQPIGGVSFSTAAGVAGVYWPMAILLLVGDDNQHFYQAGELIGLSEPQGLPQAKGYSAKRFRTDKIVTHGRYVKLLVNAYGPNPYLFSDEVEVYRGEDTLLSKPHSGNPITDVEAYNRLGIARSAITRRIVLDAQAIRMMLSTAILPLKERERLDTELTIATSLASRLPDIDLGSFRAVLPLNELHARLFRVQAAVWRASGTEPVTAWQSSLWDPLSVTGPLPPTPQTPRIDIALMQGEYRADAFNLSNTTERDLALQLRFESIPIFLDTPSVTVHEVAWTDTKLGLPVASALPVAQRVDKDYIIHIPTGMTQQVWLTFHPTGIKAGIYEGNIVVRGSGLKSIVVPLRLRVSPLQFPSRPTLGLGGWDYTDADRYLGVTPENVNAFLSYLHEYLVDTPWATSAVMPAVLDFGRLDSWLARWPNARSYRVFLHVGKSFFGADLGPLEFEKKVGAWISGYVLHLKQKGIRANQLGVLLVDEPSNPVQDAVIIAWAKAIRTAEPDVRIWEDPAHKNPAAATTMLAACDILCLNRPNFIGSSTTFRDVYAKQRAAGRTLNFYSCSGPVSSLDPYTYHRLQAWTSWQQGATAEFFWAFGDNGGGSTWNEYSATGTNYSPLFLDDRTVTPAKHMEAIREGVEDFEYLVMLHDRIGQLERAGQTSAKLTSAKNLLATAADRVLNAPAADKLDWAAPKDRTVADQVRLEILNTLESLLPMGDK